LGDFWVTVAELLGDFSVTLGSLRKAKTYSSRYTRPAYTRIISRGFHEGVSLGDFRLTFGQLSGDLCATFGRLFGDFGVTFGGLVDDFWATLWRRLVNFSVTFG
jgi:hypothetical protein